MRNSKSARNHEKVGLEPRNCFDWRRALFEKRIKVNYENSLDEVISAKDFLQIWQQILDLSQLSAQPKDLIPSCRRFPLLIGNLLKQSLSEIWSSSIPLSDLRNNYKLKGHGYRCLAKSCFGCRTMSYILAGDPFTADPHCYLGVSSQKNDSI